MLSYKITELNLDLISVLNDGVVPLTEDVPTYFIYDGHGPNDIITENDLHEKFKIRSTINEVLGRYLIDKK